MDSKARGWKKALQLWKNVEARQKMGGGRTSVRSSRQSLGLPMAFRRKKKAEFGFEGVRVCVWKPAPRPRLNSEERRLWRLACWDTRHERVSVMGLRSSWTVDSHCCGSYPPRDPWSMFSPSNHCLSQQTRTVSSVSEIESAIPHNVQGKTSKRLFNYQPSAQIWQLIHSLQTTHTVNWMSSCFFSFFFPPPLAPVFIQAPVSCFHWRWAAGFQRAFICRGAFCCFPLMTNWSDLSRPMHFKCY